MLADTPHQRVAAAARQIAGQATLLRWIGVEPGNRAVPISVCGERKSTGTRKSCRSVACPAIGCAAVVKPLDAMLADTPHPLCCCRCAPDRGTSHAPTVDRCRIQEIAAMRITACGERKSTGTRKTCRSVACPAIGCAAVVKPRDAMLADTPHSPYCCRCAPDRGTSHAPTYRPWSLRADYFLRRITLPIEYPAPNELSTPSAPLGRSS